MVCLLESSLFSTPLFKNWHNIFFFLGRKMAQAASVDAEGTDENVVSLNKGDPEEEVVFLKWSHV